jgi:type IV secretory pathway VirB10-like protein
VSGLEPDPPPPPPPRAQGPAAKAAPDTVRVSPRRPITRYRPVVIAAILGGVMLLVGLGFVIGLGGGGARKTDAAEPSAQAGDDPTPIETGLPARYDDPGALPAAGTAGLPPPETGAATPPVAGSASAPAPTGASPASVSPEVQRARQQAQAAQASSPFFGGASAPRAASVPVSPAPPSAVEPAAGAASPPSGSAPSSKEQFIAATAARGPGAPILPRPPLSPFEIKAGTLIPAALLTGINSDLPGAVIAQVTEPVFDHRTGRIALIPQGARLLGRYDSQVGYGQERVLVVWTRLIYPQRSLRGSGRDGRRRTPPEPAASRPTRSTPTCRVLARAMGLSTLISIGADGGPERRCRAAATTAWCCRTPPAGSSASRQPDRPAAGRARSAAPPRSLSRRAKALRVLIDRDLILPPEASTARPVNSWATLAVPIPLKFKGFIRAIPGAGRATFISCLAVESRSYRPRHDDRTRP